MLTFCLQALDIGNYVLTGLFTLEMIVKLFGLGFWDYVQVRYSTPRMGMHPSMVHVSQHVHPGVQCGTMGEWVHRVGRAHVCVQLECLLAPQRYKHALHGGRHPLWLQCGPWRHAYCEAASLNHCVRACVHACRMASTSSMQRS